MVKRFCALASHAPPMRHAISAVAKVRRTAWGMGHRLRSALLAEISEQDLLPPFVVGHFEKGDIDRFAIPAAGWHGHAVALRVEDDVEHFDMARKLPGCDPGKQRLVVHKCVERTRLERFEAVLRCPEV